MAILRLFSFALKREEANELQLGWIERVFKFLMKKNSSIMSSKLMGHEIPELNKTLLVLLGDHLYSEAVVEMVLQLFDPGNQKLLIASQVEEINEQQYLFIEECFARVPQLSRVEVLNLTAIYQEVLSKWYDITNEFFIQPRVLDTFLEFVDSGNAENTQNGRHLLGSSLLQQISLLYTHILQNVQIHQITSFTELEDELLELQNSFEISDYMQSLGKHLPTIKNEFSRCLKSHKLSQHVLVLLEFFDNTLRISNLKLWELVDQAGLFGLFLDLFFEFPKANILHVHVDKTLTFLFNRVISDFHPFWALKLQELHFLQRLSKLIIKHKKCGPYLKMVNTLNWFQKEITEKHILDVKGIKYLEEVEFLIEYLEDTQEWLECQNLAIKLNAKNLVELGNSTDVQNYSMQIDGYCLKFPISQSVSSQSLEVDEDFYCRSKPNDDNKLYLNVTKGDHQLERLRFSQSERSENSERGYVASFSPNFSPITSPEKRFMKKKPNLNSSNSGDFSEDFQFKLEDKKETPKIKMQRIRKLERQIRKTFDSPICSPTGSDEEMDSEQELKFYQRHRSQRVNQSLESSTKLKSTERESQEKYRIIASQKEKALISPDQNILKVDEIDLEKKVKYQRFWVELGKEVRVVRHEEVEKVKGEKKSRVVSWEERGLLKFLEGCE